MAISTPPIVKLVLTAAEAAITVVRVYCILCHLLRWSLIGTIFDVWKSFWTERSAFMTVMRSAKMMSKKKGWTPKIP